MNVSLIGAADDDSLLNQASNQVQGDIVVQINRVVITATDVPIDFSQIPSDTAKYHERAKKAIDHCVG
jgi:hypothetical protein